MNRRGFLGSITTLAAAAWLSPNVLAMAAPVTGLQQIYFKNIPLKFDAKCPNNTMYFMNSKGVWKLDSNGTHRM